ncbi:MAG: hypothetical protein N3A38_08775 [Planctomycetota bacterium]|nr:hypothetical protein [Planctomycetota bacterium]
MFREFDRSRLRVRPLADRDSKLAIEDVAISPDNPPPDLGGAARQVARVARRVAESRRAGRPVMLTFGAHAIKNGLAPVMIRLIERGWITHLATNGAGSIHDWEFAFLGRSAEDVRANIASGTFGLWDETGRIIALAVAAGALEGRGYGESVGAVIEREELSLPSDAELLTLSAGTDPEKAGAAADLRAVLAAAGERGGRTLRLPHRWKRFSVQAAAFRLGVPFTVHAGIGYDIIYEHPAACGGAYGRAAMRDFLIFAESVRGLSGGVYLSVGSAVMSPMIFEKAMAMSVNAAIQEGGRIRDHFICVVDLADENWKWSGNAEPPPDDPAYYLRFCKSFHRMGGEMEYIALDNRAFLQGLWTALRDGGCPYPPPLGGSGAGNQQEPV